jgi:hypothetical protein
MQAVARVGADGVLMVGDVFGVIAGLEATVRPSKTEIIVDEENAGSTLVVDPSAVLGVRFEL